MSSTESSPTGSEQTSTEHVNGGAGQNESPPAGGLNLGGVDLAAIIERARKITVDPIGTWPEIRDEQTTIESIYRNYLVYLAAIPAVAGFLGQFFKRGLFGNLFSHLVMYVIMLAAFYVLAMLIEFLAPKFDGGGSRTEAFKLAAYSHTPGLLAGVFNLIPVLSILGALAGLYGIYVFYQGIEPLVRVTGPKRIPFMLSLAAAGIVVGIAVMIVTLIAG